MALNRWFNGFMFMRIALTSNKTTQNKTVNKFSIAVQDERQTLKDLCYETKLDFNLINIMTQPSLQFPVERLLLAFFTLSD